MCLASGAGTVKRGSPCKRNTKVQTGTERNNNGTSNKEDGVMCLVSGAGTVRTGSPCKRNTKVQNWNRNRQ